MTYIINDLRPFTCNFEATDANLFEIEMFTTQGGDLAHSSFLSVLEKGGGDRKNSVRAVEKRHQDVHNVTMNHNICPPGNMIFRSL